MIKCACGCGELIESISDYGTYRRPKRFKLGHNLKSQKGPTHPQWKGGRKISSGYISIQTPKHPYCDNHGYVPEHRLVMEKYLGRYLDPKETVHHKNHDTLDNRIENLQLAHNQSDHVLIHKEERRKDIENRICAICNGKTVIRTNNVRHKRLDGRIIEYTYTYLNWYRNPLDKSQWVCESDYGIIRNNMKSRKKW